MPQPIRLCMHLVTERSDAQICLDWFPLRANREVSDGPVTSLRPPL